MLRPTGSHKSGVSICLVDAAQRIWKLGSAVLRWVGRPFHNDVNDTLAAGAPCKG